MTFRKSLDVYSKYQKQSSQHMQVGNYEAAVELQTIALTFAPCFVQYSNSQTKYLLAEAYGARAAVNFDAKLYGNCVKDLELALKNGVKNTDEIQSKLAICYWHLNSTEKCKQIIDIWFSKNNGFKSAESKTFQVLRKKLEGLSKGCKNNKNKNEVLHCDSVLTSSFRGLSPHYQIMKNDSKGRFIVTTKNTPVNDMLIFEEPKAAVINNELKKLHCNYCFKSCHQDGIPCHCCSNALYCSESCRLLAWKRHHWFECPIQAILLKLDDVFAHVALRIILNEAYHELDDEKSKSSHSFTSIARHMQNNQHTTMDGSDPVDHQYKADYWSVYCLQTHSNTQTDEVLSKCSSQAKFLAHVITKILTAVNDDARQHTNPASAMAHMFRSLTRKYCVDDNNLDVFQFHSIVEDICAQHLTRKLDHTTSTNAGKAGETFEDTLSYILQHHMLQLYTNAQAIFGIVTPTAVTKSASTSENISSTYQRRLATAVYPSLSLLNHSCMPNTVINFSGRNAVMKTLKPLRKGEEVTHCYGPCVWRHSLEERQKMLKEQYFFTCKCKICNKSKIALDSDEVLWHDKISAYACPTCSGPLKTKKNKSSLIGNCRNCERKVDLRQSVFDCEKILDDISSMKSNEKTMEQINQLMDYERKLYKYLYKSHRAFAEIHDKLAFLHSHVQNWKTAARHSLKALTIIQLQFGESSLEVAREYHKLATLELRAMSCPPRVVIGHLEKARDIFTIQLLPHDEELVEVTELLALSSN